MDGTSKYVNLKTGPGGTSLPPGNSVGDLLQWNGVEWAPAAVSAGGQDTPVDLHSIATLGEIANVIPAGHQLVHVTLINNNSESSVTAKLGWTSGGGQLLDGEEIPAGGWIDIPVARLFSLTVATSLWIASEDMQDEGFTLLAQHKKYVDA